MVKDYLVLTAVGRDRVGIVEIISDVVVKSVVMQAKKQAPPHISLGQLRRKLAGVGEELDVDIEIRLPKS